MLVLTETDIFQKVPIEKVELDRSYFLIELADKHKGLRKLVGHHKPAARKNFAPNEDERFRIERARYARLEDQFRVQCSNMIRSYLSGHISQRQLVKNFSSQLSQFQVSMYLQGKRTSGIMSVALSNEERSWLHGQHSLEMKYFHGFMRDVANGSGKMDYQKRMDLYGVGGYSLYLRGVIAATPDLANALWTWNLNARAEHCQECVRRHWYSRSVKGVSTKYLLKNWGLPGERTPCGNMCRCGCSTIGDDHTLTRTRPTSFTHLKQLFG